MKHSVLKQNFLAASLAVTAIVGGQSLVNAAEPNNSANQTATPAAVPTEVNQSPVVEVTQVNQPTSPATGTGVTVPTGTVVPATPAGSTTVPSQPTEAAPASVPTPGVTAPAIAPAVPEPGTVPTNASPLQGQTEPAPSPTMEQTTPAQAQPTETQPAAQFVRTRYKFSYIGIGPNFGFGGKTALGNISFSAFSKFAITPQFSFRPGVMIAKSADFLLPVTYDFPIPGPGHIAPFAGLGAKFSTSSQDAASLLLTGGVDYPINRDLVATAALNLGVIGKVDAGVSVGLAYSFGQQTIQTAEGLGAVGNEINNILGRNPSKPNPGYIGAGINFGTGGGGGLGRTSAAAYSKFPLSSYLSFRPALMITNQLSFLFPVTYDFNQIRISENIRLFPYAGTGISFNTGKNNVGWLLSAGVDVPITSNFVSTLGFNINPTGNFAFGFLLGVGYSFGKF